MIDVPSLANNFHDEHCRLLARSFESLLRAPLIGVESDDVDLSQKLWNCDAVVLSHGTEEDPIFNYGNQLAQKLFEVTWSELTEMPSRLSAELPNREERARLLAEVSSKGYIQDYSGVRISKSGRRFLVSNATVWNLLDHDGNFAGQAATFTDYKFL